VTPGSVSFVTERGGGVEIDDYFRSLGATDAQIAEARQTRRLPSLAGDLVLAADHTLSATELARRSGLDLDTVLTVWRTLGVAVPDADVDRPLFSERDAEFTSFVVKFEPAGLQGEELLRVLGTSLARVAEAAVSLYVQTVEPALDESALDGLVWARNLAQATAGALKIGDSMGAIFAHHMQGAIDRQRIAQVDVADRSLYRLAVGFVDLVGFTPLALHTAPSKLLELISDFELNAFEVASAHGGRIVKHIGDEVMFVALDATAGCAIARDITAAYAEGIEPRAGVAFGEVITRHGDYYGSVVNLAARLAELAVPREVLVDEATARLAADSFVFRPAGQRQLKGFDGTREVFSVHGIVPG
jgi:adenylate cyclase